MHRSWGGAIKKWQIFSSIASIIGLLCFSAVAFGASSGAISQSFTADSTNSITSGTILSLTPNTDTIVEPANSLTSATNLEGIAANKPLVELSNNQKNEVEVVVGGTTSTLVSNINGNISIGNRITASPISGVGMKATTTTEVVGTAQASLSSVKTITKTVTDKTGQQIAIKVGLLPVTVDVSYYSAMPSTNGIAEYVPPFLQNIANSIARGKSVSPLRVLIGTAGVFLGLAIVLIMLYTSIRSSLTATGGNRFAKGVLHKGLVDLLVVSAGILLVAAVSVYAIITI
jgi:hypothetical protein